MAEETNGSILLAPVPAGAVVIPAFAAISQSGSVHDGRSEVDESAVTGEVVPVLKQAGDRLLAGSRNGAGRLVLLPESDLPAEAMARPPLAAEQAKSPDPVIGPFLRPLFRRLLLIDLAAFAAGIVWLLRHGHPITLAGLALMVVGLVSPCLFLVWPLQRLAVRGWLKLHRLHCPDIDRLHDLRRIPRIVFGRHGTLSQGHLRIVSLQPGPMATAGELMVLAASAHQDVEDIWGRAFLAFGISHRVHLRPAEKLVVEPGLGLSALVTDRTVLVGRPAWLEQHGIAIEGLDEPVQEHLRLGRRILFVGIAAPEPRCLGVIAFADPTRTGTSQLIRTCKQSGITTVFVGDTSQTATATLAGLAGTTDVVAEQDSGKFDDETTLAIARASDIGLLKRYPNAVAHGETALQRLPGIPFGIRRNDTRHVLDFVVLAQVMSSRLPVTLLLVWMTGWPLVAEGLGLLAIPPMLRVACIAAGFLIALVQSQLLRLVDSLANDEHED